MKAIITIFLALSCSLSNAAYAVDIKVIHAGHLLLATEEVKAEQTIIIRDGTIDAVLNGYHAEILEHISSKDQVTFYDLKDFFVLPGLIDGHVHLTSEFGPRSKLEYVERSDADVALKAAHYAQILLMEGFTTVRDVGAIGGDAVFALRDAVARGDIIGPRIFASGDTISPTGGHAQRHGLRQGIMELMESSGRCDGVDKCRMAVRSQVRRGADHIKLVATGGVVSDVEAGTGQQFVDEELRVIIETAQNLGRRATAHAHGADGINAALRNGANSIEHGTFSNQESFQLFKRNNAYLVPTILAGVTVSEYANNPQSFLPAAIRSKASHVGTQSLRNAREAHAAGVRIAFGTDIGIVPYGSSKREFELLIEAGLTPREAIRAATINGADNIGKLTMLGTIETGKYADIIAVRGNPLTDISQLSNIQFVMKNGETFKTPNP
jgi:imidazolonepropionase-like amidohydrolase